MKRTSLLKYLFLIISFSLFSSNLFSQPSVFLPKPADPGDDPMAVDSAKCSIPLKPNKENKSTTLSIILSEKKEDAFINKKSDNTYLKKNDEEDTHMVF